MSRVDVIVPCYNYGRYLRSCVESILCQEGVDVRVLIIDDASSDDTAAVACKLAEENPRVELRRHQSNQGHIATYNEGLEWAARDYVLLISADDSLLPAALNYSTRILDQEPSVVLTYGRQILFQDESDPRDNGTGSSPPDVQVLPGFDFIEICCKTASNPVTTPTVVARRSAVKKVGAYRADLPHTADLELWLRLASIGDIGVIDAYQALKRTHSANMQHEYLRSEVGDIQQRRAAFERFFEFNTSQRELNAERRRWTENALAMDAFWASTRAFERGDKVRHRQLLDIALSLDPEFTRRPEWFRLRLKQLLGTKICGHVQPLTQKLRTLNRGDRAHSYKASG